YHLKLRVHCCINITGRMSKYVYAQLQSPAEFRLLELQPGHGDDPILGRLFHANLDSPPDYQAISYVWGDHDMNFILETPQGIVPLTASLQSALKRFRKADSTTLLWADGVCINQNDDHEKGHQVKVMRK